MKLAAATIAAGLVALFPAPAAAQLQAPGSVAPCAAALATAGGTAWTCPFGGIRGIVDVEGGTVATEPDGRLDRGKLRLNMSGGEARDPVTGDWVREAIALNPDLGGCTRVYDGRRAQLASFCPTSFPDGGVRFYTEPLICTDICRAVATVQPAPPPRALIPATLKRRVARLERVVRLERRRAKRLRQTVRRLLRRNL
jgi:hypothetical protein